MEDDEQALLSQTEAAFVTGSYYHSLLEVIILSKTCHAPGNSH